MICVKKEETDKTVLVVSEKGFGKRTEIDEYRITNRGGKGVKTISVTDKTGPLVGIMDVKENEDLMITCKSGLTIRTGISDIRAAGRATQGVKLISLQGNDEIAAITKLDEVEEVIQLADSEGIVNGDQVPNAETTNDSENTSDEQTTPVE
jgi:DNA gyrase subunit A